jgi:hypothetical protein
VGRVSIGGDGKFGSSDTAATFPRPRGLQQDGRMAMNTFS